MDAGRVGRRARAILSSKWCTAFHLAEAARADVASEAARRIRERPQDPALGTGGHDGRRKAATMAAAWMPHVPPLDAAIGVLADAGLDAPTL